MNAPERDNLARVITIDGPAGVGKSTIAAKLAETLGLPMLDSGAMFRKLALDAPADVDAMTDSELAAFCQKFHFGLTKAGLVCNGAPLGAEIRSEAVGARASSLAKRAPARLYLLNEQRKIGAASPLVAEGRDMGTVVFPQARHKFFLDARPEIRAERRWLQNREKGRDTDIAELAAEMAARDQRDRQRTLAPLKPAPDATIIDTSDLSQDQVLAAILAAIKNKGGIF